MAGSRGRCPPPVLTVPDSARVLPGSRDTTPEEPQHVRFQDPADSAAAARFRQPAGGCRPLARLPDVFPGGSVRWLRHGRHRLHRPLADAGLGRGQAGPGSRAQCGTVRPGCRCPDGGAAGRSLGTAPGAYRFGGGVRRRLSGLGLLAGSDHAHRTALHHRRGTGGGHAQCRHAGQ